MLRQIFLSLNLMTAGGASVATATTSGCDGALSLTPAALRIADQIAQLYVDSNLARVKYGTPSTLAMDGFALITEFIREGLGTPDLIERALRARDVPVFLMAVHRDFVGNPRLEIRDLLTHQPVDHYIHFSGSGREEADRQRRNLGVPHDAQNLVNLKTAGVLVKSPPAVVREDVARYVAQVNAQLDSSLALHPPPDTAMLTEAVTHALIEYLKRFIDVSPVVLDEELRRSGSLIHLLAVHLDQIEPRGRVMPIGGRLPNGTSYTLQILLAKPEQRAKILTTLRTTDDENGRRLAEVGLWAEGVDTGPRAN